MWAKDAGRLALAKHNDAGRIRAPQAKGCEFGIRVACEPFLEFGFVETLARGCQ
jgi:hypothetical protein